AEDGIRDLTVTGVQTCALPILAQHEAVVELLQLAVGREAALEGVERPGVLTGGGERAAAFADVPRELGAQPHAQRRRPRRIHLRSEERRVGKEGSAGG